MESFVIHIGIYESWAALLPIPVRRRAIKAWNPASRGSQGSSAESRIILNIDKEKLGMNRIQRFSADEHGFVVSSELVLIGTILVLGVVVGLATVRDQVVQELGDLALAISNINQSYSFSGVTGHTSSVAGSIFDDQLDFCDSNTDVAATEPACISVQITASNE